jgi:hypothetical protein
LAKGTVVSAANEGLSGAPLVCWAACFGNEVQLGAFVFRSKQEGAMNQIIYIVGLVVIVIAVLSFFGLR